MTLSEAVAILLTAKISGADKVDRAAEYVLTLKPMRPGRDGRASPQFEPDKVNQYHQRGEPLMSYDEAIAILQNAVLHNDNEAFIAAEIVLEAANATSCKRQAASVIAEAIRAHRRPHTGAAARGILPDL